MFGCAYAGRQRYHAIELFGLSRRVQRCFERRGFLAASLDIRLGRGDDPEQDILSRRGWFNYLDHLMQMLPGALLVAGPPCSLFVYMVSPDGQCNRPELRNPVALLEWANTKR
ncbi:RHM1, partial [Symbiodinium pilosum]